MLETKKQLQQWLELWMLCGTPLSLATLQSPPLRPAIAEVHIRLRDRGVTKGVIVPAHKVTHLPQTPSTSSKIPLMACVRTKIIGRTKQQAVGNLAIIRKTKMPPSPTRLDGLDTYTCHGHCCAFSYQFRFDFSD